MKPCDNYRELLPEFLEGALGADRATDVAMHLADCDECRKELHFVRDLTSAARRLPQPRPDDNVVLRMMEAVCRSETPARRTEFGPVLSVEELAEYLRVDAETLKPYLDDIPCFELGGKPLYRRKTVEEWIRQKEQSLGFAFGPGSKDRPAALGTIETGGAQWTL